MTIEEILEREAQFMGRAVTYRNAWETTFRNADGKDKTMTVVLYACAPMEMPGSVTIHEDRFTVYVDGVQQTGGIV